MKVGPRTAERLTVPSTLLRFLAWRLLRALVLVLVVASAALVLVHAAPGDAFSEVGADPQVAAAERQRLGLDRPFPAQLPAARARAGQRGTGCRQRLNQAPRRKAAAAGARDAPISAAPRLCPATAKE